MNFLFHIYVNGIAAGITVAPSYQKGLEQAIAALTRRTASQEDFPIEGNIQLDCDQLVADHETEASGLSLGGFLGEYKSLEEIARA